MKQKKNIIFVDCTQQEIQSFVDGFNEASDEKYELKVSIANWGHGGLMINLRRYLAYVLAPLKLLRHRKEFGNIVCWQQFYAINYAFFCRLFRLKRHHKTLVAVNFTYKRKAGLLGKIYHKYMVYACRNKYIDYFHIPSYNYVTQCCEELGLRPEQFLVVHYGVPDTYDEMKDLKVDFDGEYVFSIGRSNRDFDFLVDVWRQDCLKPYHLVIASDVWQPSGELPSNITFRNDITYEQSFAWLNNCKLSITSTADGSICSGDTVLITSMMLGKPVVVTSPSTLAEMYVRDDINGLSVPKDTAQAASMIAALLGDRDRMARLAASARQSFVDRFSRHNMARTLCQQLSGRTSQPRLT